MHIEELLSRSVAIDLEATPEGKLFRVGAVNGYRGFDRSVGRDPRAVLDELADFARGARFLVGHNLLAHDLELIRQLHPRCATLQMPVIDTLVLSPLAFPENPYHALLKDYKLVSDAVNNPVADARLAMRVFKDECNAFASIPDAIRPALLGLYRDALGSDLGDRGGFASLFDALGAGAGRDPARAFTELVGDRVCHRQVARLMTTLERGRATAAMAFAASWLRVAGGNSVLPPWVRHSFPQVVDILGTLRDVACGDASCAYCVRTHDPTAQLKRWFDFERFRPEPRSPDGGSLQEAIVAAGMRRQPLLAILPTGGGKSLCFQVPALARYERRGVLTIVISPLQALMKDQVDNVADKTGSPASAALYGMLTPPERGEIMERVRLGDIGLLYVSPEQLRNPSFRSMIEQREIGAWVFDEAHCLSKWGHDFRPDYLYASRFIRELAESQKVAIPPVACFTATAKRDVIQEIRDHFDKELGQRPILFESDPSRDNLRFEIQPVKPQEKLTRVLELLNERLAPNGSAIVYVSTRKNAQLMADHLGKGGWVASAYHAGLESQRKRDIQERFVSGDIRVIAATNAFGMGIDKDNVRLVVHADMPGSLENYLQEAGRAGRDQKESECVLLFCEDDLERQFSMTTHTQLTRRDIAQILRGLRKTRRKGDSVVITCGELLRSEDVDIETSDRDRFAETRVKTAIAWLENARFVQRNENRNAIWQGRVLVGSLAESAKKIGQLGLSARKRRHWGAILSKLINQDDPTEGLTADELMCLPQLYDAFEGRDGEVDSMYVLRILREMEEVGLVKQTMMLTALVRHKVVRSSLERLSDAAALERAMLSLMEESAPDTDEDEWLTLSLREMNQRLECQDEKTSIQQLRELLLSLKSDGRSFGEGFGSIEIRHCERDKYRVKVRRPWPKVREFSELRTAAMAVILDTILGKITDPTLKGAELLVEFSVDELITALRSDLVLASRAKDFMDLVHRVLNCLHDLRVIVMQQGMAVFRQAMTIDVLPESKGRAYTRGDFAPLEAHYAEQVMQIHVMAEYAKRGIDDLPSALRLVLAYFQMSRTSFVKRYFAGREQMLERAISQDAYRRIVDDLDNPTQSAIVSASHRSNMLVLAGPGSGKTRTIVHRVAYLLQVERVPASSILVLCFNRLAMLQLRTRLRQLVGPGASRVVVLTYHGLAMRLSGVSPAVLFELGETQSIDFEQMIRSATELLRGERELPGLEADEIRDRLLAGYQYILVDEYQDIDQGQYDLISAIAGRTLQEDEVKLSILAVGDDDQNIYSFRGANVEFIRRFRADYEARCHYLVDNYRSTANIIETANRFISHNRDRMKTEHPIMIDRHRRHDPPGGALTESDPVSDGRVQVIEVAGQSPETVAIVNELERIGQLECFQSWTDCAVLAPTRAQLHAIRALCELREIPVRLSVDRNGIPRLHRIREIALALDCLKSHRDEICLESEIRSWIDAAWGDRPRNAWHRVAGSVLDQWCVNDQDVSRPVADLIEHFYESIAEQQRDQSYGTGVFLGTVHGAKGTEFDYVLVPNDGWYPAVEQREQEEKRRVYYVAMTRSRRLLTLFESRDRPNPHSPRLVGDPVRRRPPVARECVDLRVLDRQYALVGLGDLFIGYASGFEESHPIHKTLSEMEVGDAVQLSARGSYVVMTSASGREITRLSRSAAQEWHGRLDRIQDVRVLAMLENHRDATPVEHRDRCRVDRWELPLVEIVWTPT